MPYFFALIATFVSITVSFTASAWDRAGHQAVCAKAWQEMTDTTRTAVSDLLDASSAQAFTATCMWADEIVQSRPETRPWHFITIPKTERSIDLARDCPDGNCVVAQIERQSAVIAGPAPKAERADALRYLVHLVADVHQPLHVAFAEDRLGENVRLAFLGRDMNMHALWDGELLKAPNPPSHGYTPYLQEMADRHNRERWTGATPRDWAQETLWIMRAAPTGYVGNPGGLVFDELYVQQNYLVATEQLDKAGVRLGAWLNTLFAKEKP